MDQKFNLEQYLKNLSKRSVFIVFGGLILLSAIGWLGLELVGGTEKLEGFVRDAGPWAPVAFILAKASTYVIAPLSGGPLKIVAGALFGFGPGVIYSVAGDLLGGSINFWMARIIGRPAVARLSGKKALKQTDNFVHKIGDWKALLAARILLTAVYDFVSYAAGFSNLKYKTYFWVTLVGGIPGSAIAVGTGSVFVNDPLLAIGLILALALMISLYFHLNKSRK